MPPTGPVEARAMEKFADQRDDGEIDADDAGGGKRVGEAALEDDVHVHQAVADDGVAEAERDQREREDRQFHPRRGTRPKTYGTM